ncbi:pseudomonapepsin [Dictyobacter sp. S3.2.2.5]|uniref:Pseudomonapepsin n=2 Tax=Dictyobacter halimunensis TaxID=3026934 RepID=A0ABQ6G2L8_9CHLR|nr:pseudomonapepsin [Dictyobacter sp. S3.2.2.5]
MGMGDGSSASLTLAAPGAAHVLYGRIPGHVVPVVTGRTPIGPRAQNASLRLSISLSLRNTQALDVLLAQQNDPTSPRYHSYLTPQQFKDQFGPTQQTVNKVVSYLKSNGILVTEVTPNNLLLKAATTVGVAERAFLVGIDNYVVGTRVVYAPSNNPAVPASLASSIQYIAGLDNITVRQPRHIVRPVHRYAGPIGGYNPATLSTAYNATPLLNTGANGAGQSIALFELDGYNAADIDTYRSTYKLGTGKYVNVLVDNAVNIAGPGSIEVELDMEVVSAVAPQATQRVYIGPNTTPGVNDTYNQMVTDNKAKVISTSWGLCETSSGNAELAALDSIFKQGAAQGQSFFAASGDAGAYDCGDSNLGVDSPAGDPYVVAVGGTNLHTGTNGSYGTEAAWDDTTTAQGGSMGTGGGGGISSYFKRPAYQNGLKMQNANRQIPDVSANADPVTGYSIYCMTAIYCQGWGIVGGTSASAPLWAGIAADVNQYLTAQKRPTLGNANSMLYRLDTTSLPYPAYHDIVLGNNLYYKAGVGYDLATGIGTLNIWNIARDLVALPGGTVKPTPTPTPRPTPTVKPGPTPGVA